MRVLAIIPARGGSKGIPRKNIRVLAGKPLVAYAIQTALGCSQISDVVVSTDDQEIQEISQLYGSFVLHREKHLSEDHVSLDPVIHNAVLRMEEIKKERYDIVVTLQPTSPLLTVETLSMALSKFIGSDCDSMLSCVNKPHLSWGKNQDGNYIPKYEKRLNRQYLPPDYLETGAFLITRRKFVSEESRLGSNVSVFEVPHNEAVDIDDVGDWVTCEHALKRKKIVFRAEGHRELGMGHIYRCLTLAFSMIDHDVLFVISSKSGLGIEKVRGSYFNIRVIENDAQFMEVLADYKPDIIVNDTLDTTKDYVLNLKRWAAKVVSLEDIGEGRLYADLVINELYPEDKFPHVYSGHEYVCLREEFVVTKPCEFNSELKKVLVMFGGTDPSDLNIKLYKLALKINQDTNNRYSFIFLTGLGYKNIEVMPNPDYNINVLRDVKRVTAHMNSVDLAFTSQGRTIFELASMGIPSVVLSQNEREQLHGYAQLANGFINLGLGSLVDEDTLHKTFLWLAETPDIRKEMRDLMLRHNLKSGIGRVRHLILEG